MLRSPLDAVSPGVASGARVAWTYTEVTSQGGQYRLCWCAELPHPSIYHGAKFVNTTFDAGPWDFTDRAVNRSWNESSNGTAPAARAPNLLSRCSGPRDHVVDFGELTIMGPNPFRQDPGRHKRCRVLAA